MESFNNQREAYNVNQSVNNFKYSGKQSEIYDR